MSHSLSNISVSEATRIINEVHEPLRKRVWKTGWYISVYVSGPYPGRPEETEGFVQIIIANNAKRRKDYRNYCYSAHYSALLTLASDFVKLVMKGVEDKLDSLGI